MFALSVELIVVAGSAAICAATASSGSTANPSIAVTLPVVEEAAAVKADGVLIPEDGLDTEENVARRRNIADGFSLESLCVEKIRSMPCSLQNIGV